MTIFQINQILEWTGCRLANADALGKKQVELQIRRISPLETSKEDSIVFFFQQKFANLLTELKAGALVTSAPFVPALKERFPRLWNEVAILVHEDPYGTMSVLSAHFAPEEVSKGTFIHPSSVISKSAKIGESVSIGPHCVIEDGVEIGSHSRLVANVFVGKDSKIGESSVLFANVSVYHSCKIGKRVRIHSGVVIGADGFGYAPLLKDGKPIEQRKIFHLGGVVIGDDVEIGANSCVDRGTFGDTEIGRGAKIDNLVQIGHNCSVGEGAILCGASGLAGSASVGRFAYIGGGAGIGNRIRVGDYARVGAYTLVTKEVEPGQEVLGNPMRGFREHLRLQAALNKMFKKERKSP